MVKCQKCGHDSSKCPECGIPYPTPKEKVIKQVKIAGRDLKRGLKVLINGRRKREYPIDCKRNCKCQKSETP